MVLKHFKIPEIFIRRTKNAYISFVSDEILKLARDCNNTSCAAIKAFTKRNCLEMNMNYCRKIFATYLRNNGIEQEIIDLLQGRIPKSIFVRHYYRPDFNIYDKVKILITQMHNAIVKGKM
jgi:intergrase/recombinase